MTQIYEEYWKITLAYTDFYGNPFNEALALIVNFIDRTRGKKYSEEKYSALQEELASLHHLNGASIRKVINTYLKLGFVNTELMSYHPDTPAFLREKNKIKKKSIFSKIVYDNSSLDRSATRDSNKREISFLIKTLEKVEKLNKNDILALMYVDILKFPKGYLNKEELVDANRYIAAIDSNTRKYNQKSHFWAVLRNLDDLVIIDDYLYLKDNAPEITVNEKEGRDAYLQMVFKNQLKAESYDSTGLPECMIERISYPSLVASHIKPFRKSSKKEAYDVNNGLLLSRNLDVLFDRGYISFDDFGKIMLSSRLSENVKNYLNKYFLDSKYLNDKRKEYLEYHRNEVFNESDVFRNE